MSILIVEGASVPTILHSESTTPALPRRRARNTQKAETAAMFLRAERQQLGSAAGCNASKRDQSANQNSMQKLIYAHIQNRKLHYIII